MKRKIHLTLGQKIVAMILALAVILCVAALAVTYRTYKSHTMELYSQLAQDAAATLASQLDPEELDHYYETGTVDQRYYEIQQFIFDLVDSTGVEYLYVVRPHGTGVTFLFDSDMEMGESGDYLAGGYCALGTYIELEGAFAANIDRFLDGEEVEPIVAQDPSFGWLMTAMEPVLHDNGAMAGYVMADLDMNGILQEQKSFLLVCGGLLAGLTALATAVYLVLARRSLIQPIRQLTQAAQEYEGGSDSLAFRRVKIRGNDELRSLADAFHMMLAEINLNNMEHQEVAVREQRLESELQLARALNVSLLPKALPPREGGYPFEIRGRLEQGEELACCFYDYFLLEGERLCLLLGEVPGHGTPQVIYTVMAQATIKSQIRSGLSLTAALTAANQQLYEVGNGLSIQVLAGVLDGISGRFTYVNAGQRPPLVMGSGAHYEWSKAHAYDPLGQNENVVYQAAELELRQGDRLLFHSQGLDKLRSGQGESFAPDGLQLALNEKSIRLAGLPDQLEHLSAAANAFAGRSRAAQGYALMALEYRRRDRAQAHCLLTPDGPGSGELTAFLRGQLEANGIQGGPMARLLVLADELFALCCRRAPRDGRLMAECAIPPGDDLVILRLRGDLGGISPLEQLEDEAAEHAASFIRKHCDRLLFEHTESIDTATVVKRLAAEEREGERMG